MLHIFLQGHFFNDVQQIFMNDLVSIDRYVPSVSQSKLISVLFYGSDAFDKKAIIILFCFTGVLKNISTTFHVF